MTLRVRHIENSYDPRLLPFLEVDAHSIAHLVMQVCDSLGFGEDRFCQGAGGIATLWSFLYEKDNFVRLVHHRLTCLTPHICQHLGYVRRLRNVPARFLGKGIEAGERRANLGLREWG
jgi:hypothetical protein